MLLAHYGARQENEAILLRGSWAVKIQGERTMNGVQPTYTPDETEEARGAQNLVREDERLHLRGCTRPRQKNQFGRYGVFRPKRDYTKVLLPVTYILCDECVKLPEDTHYGRVEKWLVDHGHLVI